jgi:hypothetical protein
MPGAKKDNNDIDRISDEIGSFLSAITDKIAGSFDILENIFDVLEKAFDDLPLIRPLALLSIIGMLIYYAVFFQTFNGWNMLVFVFFFAGGIVLLALMMLYKFAELFEPYLLYRAASRKSREENQRIIETHRIMRQIIKKKSKHKEISANDVLAPKKIKEPGDNEKS